MLPWYHYVDEFLHRVLARFGYGTGWRFCDWVDRRYNDGVTQVVCLKPSTTSTANINMTWSCLCGDCRG